MKDRTELLEIVRGNLADIVGDAKLVLQEQTTASEGEDWDSINHVKLLLALEDELGIRFMPDETSQVQNVGQLLDLVATKL